MQRRKADRDLAPSRLCVLALRINAETPGRSHLPAHTSGVYLDLHLGYGRSAHPDGPLVSPEDAALTFGESVIEYVSDEVSCGCD
jgi:hypothetical protein